MLQIYAELTGDNKADEIIEKFINVRILDIIQFHLDMNMYGNIDSIKDIDPSDAEFYEYITEDISPENVSETDANGAFIELIALLLSKQRLRPSMLQNYQLFQLIGGYCDLAKDMDLETVERIPARDRKKVIEAFCRLSDDEGFTGEEIVREYENLNYYEEICFEDWDFLQLDNMTFEELKASPINQFLGMIDDNETLGMKAQILQFPSGLRQDDKE